MDIGDVEIVVQYKASCDLCTLWQRFGRAARSPTVQGVGILLVEKKDTAHGRKKVLAGSKRGKDDSHIGPLKRQRCSRRPNPLSVVEKEESTSMDVDSNDQATLPSIDAHATLPTCAEATWLQERQGRYAKPELAPNDPTGARKGRAPGVLPDTAMDDYINIPSYVSCRRLVPRIYFANKNLSKFFFFLLSPQFTSDVVSDGHLHCDPAAPQGCERCRPRAKILCCDLCHRQSFDEFCVRETHFFKMTVTARRSVIPVSYQRSLLTSGLEDAIYEWRDNRAREHVGEGLVRRLGSQVFMTEDIVDRILGCWMFNKITDISDLCRETTWPQDLIEVHGQSLIDLLLAYPPLNYRPVTQAVPSFAPSPPPMSLRTVNYLVPSCALSPIKAVPLSVPAYPVPSHAPSPLQAIPLSPSIPTALPALNPCTYLSLNPTCRSPLTAVKIENASTTLPMSAAPHQTRKRAPIRCRNCHQVGHNHKLFS
jgi:ATP-dependent DNA helicase RecQ